MTNIDRQRSIDRQIWIESEAGKDAHGFMVYCDFCKSNTLCKEGRYDYSKLSAETTCAKAFNAMKRNYSR